MGLNEVGYILGDIVLTGANDPEHKRVSKATQERLGNYLFLLFARKESII